MRYTFWFPLGMFEYFSTRLRSLTTWKKLYAVHIRIITHFSGAPTQTGERWQRSTEERFFLFCLETNEPKNINKIGIALGDILSAYSSNALPTRITRIIVCPRSGSNQGPSDLQSDALPTELHGRTSCYLPRNQCEIEPTIEKTIVAIKSFLRAPAGNWTRI